ncbi:MAG: type II toxin-antitoxin system RelE/ParE family toxin [bacterium]|nr:type II toxin-antitoxin system RelE/ParE family toxin [bacterium]
MASLRVEFHPAAVEEAQAARQWYAERSVSVAEAFMVELDLAIERLADAPERYPRYMLGTRRCLLHRFPYMIVYRQHGDAIQVLALAHGRRRPGYWRQRR